MANVVKGLNKIVTNVGNGVNKAKKAADKVLWGSINETPAVPAPGTPPPPPTKTKVGSFIQSGLFNVLDALLQVDLCAIITYLTSTANNELAKVKRSESPGKIEQALYDLQDNAILVRQAIDTFYATPSEVLKDLKNPQPAAAPAPGTTATTNLPPSGSLVGSAMQKYNYGIVGKYAQVVFRNVGGAVQIAQGTIGATNQITQGALADPDVKAALSLIPGFNAQINALQDYLNIVDKYADFRAIPNEEFQELLKKLDTIREVCVTIENFSLAGALNLVDQFVGSDIRSQIAQLNQFLNPVKIIPTLKEINNSLRTFINTCKTIQSYIRIGRGAIKIGITLVRIFQFIAALITNTPAPLMFLTYDVTARLENAKEAAKSNSSALMKFLGQLNSLLGIILGVVQYLVDNTNALLQRLERLIAILSACPSMEGSDLVTQLQTTQKDLIQVRDELNQILADYESRQPDDFAPYKIVVVEEELVDEGITNKRRRGIALDLNGIQVAQSDLTFATDNAVIIQEVKLILRSMGLISPEIGETDLVIQQSLRYLDTDELDTNELIADRADGDSGLNSYLQGLSGTSKFRANTRTRLKDNAKKANERIARNRDRSSQYLGTINRRPR
jgi:hypothetical protein